MFPVQHVRLPACIDPIRVHEQLWTRGVRTVLSRKERAGAGRASEASIVFVLTARHADQEIDEALDALAKATHAGMTQANWGGGSGNGR